MLFPVLLSPPLWFFFAAALVLAMPLLLCRRLWRFGGAAVAVNLEAVLGRLTDGVVVFDGKGCVSSLNPMAAAIFARPADQLRGIHISRLPGVAWIGGPHAPESGEDCECLVERADGTVVNVELSLSALRLSGREVTVAVMRDVSERRLSAGTDSLIQEIYRRVLEGEATEEVIALFCRRLLALFDLGAVWLGGREQSGRISVQGFAGPDAFKDHLEGQIFRWDVSDPRPAARAILSQTLQRILPDAPDWQDLLAPLAAAGLCDGLSLPLRFGPTVFGALTVFTRRRLTDAVIGRLEDLAARIGIACQVIDDQRCLRLQGAAMTAAASAIFVTDPLGRIEWANDAFARLSGQDPAAVAEGNLHLLEADGAIGNDFAGMLAAIRSGGAWRGELRLKRRDGTAYLVDQTITPMAAVGGGVSHFVVVQEDVTDRKLAEERVHFLSSYDQMTGLPNRSFFRERLGQTLVRARTADRRVAIIFLDLNYFSRINDAMGHDLGDLLLKGIVERLISVTRSADMLARVGGDEFAVILDDPAANDTIAVLARRLLNAISRPYDIDGQEIRIGSSVGIALFPDDAQDADTLIKHADIAMYKAIHEAPNGYRFFSNSMNIEAEARNTLERDLYQAIGRDQFKLHYQPQYDLKSGRVTCLEALVRWEHPVRGQVMPASFIPLAEQNGLILPIGEEVLRLACRQIRRWLDAGLQPVPVAVNFSAMQFEQEGAIDAIVEILQEYDVDPRWLEIELTESCVMADADRAEGILRDLDGIGVKLAIDDFGTGYSSLSHLKRFPVHKLKVDQSFVRALSQENSPQGEIAGTIIALGHSLGLQVVSEGVETEPQLDYLSRHACDAVQGFLFSRPLPADDVAALLSEAAAV